MSEDFGPWFHRFRPASQNAVRLYCFPHAGGAATSFRELAKALAPDIEVLAVQYPGRQDRFGESCVESLTELADLTGAEIRRRSAGPFALLGHSMGATVAFEAARRLEEESAAPLALFASGRKAPSSAPPEVGRVLDDDALLGDIRKLGGTSAQVLDDARLQPLLLPALRADYRAVQTYRFEPGAHRQLLSCRITGMVGDRDPRVDAADVLAWGGHTSGPFDLHEFPGGHFYIDENLDSVASCIRSRILGEVRI